MSSSSKACHVKAQKCRIRAQRNSRRRQAGGQLARNGRSGGGCDGRAGAGGGSGGRCDGSDIGGGGQTPQKLHQLDRQRGTVRRTRQEVAAQRRQRADAKRARSRQARSAIGRKWGMSAGQMTTK